jgi:curved DNA-binding protein CbpA
MESAMNDALTECYDLLGLRPGASPEELKVAYRDLAKVWHPDRFVHDPRLQEKAQEKLKAINEAYDQVRSGKAKRHTQPAASSNRRPPTPEHFNQDAKTAAQTRHVAVVSRIRWQLILAPALICGVAFFVTYRSLLRPTQQEGQSEVRAIQSQAPPNPESQQPGSRDNTSPNEVLHIPDRTKSNSQREESVSAPASQASSAPLRPALTVTVVIDPYTGLIARPDCPLKSRMSYASGNEPHQLCNALHSASAAGPKDSRIKSVAKRLAAPGKWFGGAKSDAGNKQDPKSP